MFTKGLLSFKISVTYKEVFTTSQTTLSFVKQPSSDIILFLRDIVRRPLLMFRPGRHSCGCRLFIKRQKYTQSL